MVAYRSHHDNNAYFEVLNVLELFSGTGSIAKAFRQRGHNVFTVDNDPGLDPDFCIDIRELKEADIPFCPDVIWASPPCTCFSVSSIHRHWRAGSMSKEAKESVTLLSKTFEIVMLLRPQVWFIENPRGMMRKLPILDTLPKQTITYCQYGDTRMKPTDIWTNCKQWQPKPICSNGDKCHQAAPRGSKTGTQGLKTAKERGVIPQQLCDEIIKVCEQNIS